MQAWSLVAAVVALVQQYSATASWVPPKVPAWVHTLEARAQRPRGFDIVQPTDRDASARVLATSGAYTEYTGNYTGIIRVCDHVRDATGRVDVADQIQSLLDASWAAALVSNRSLDNSTFPLGYTEPDLGGLRFDLCGAHYLVSKPLHFPAGGGGNFYLSGGSIHADPEVFPEDDFVVQVDGLPINSAHAVRYRYLTFENLELDGAHRAAGCLLLIAVEEIRVLQTLCAGYTQRGLWTRGQNNEVFIMQSWFKEWSDRSLCHDSESKTGAAIWFDGNDHSIDDVVVFCSHHGVTINGSATVVRNLHVYTETPSAYPLGGIWVSSNAAGPVPGGPGGAWLPAPGNGTVVPGGVAVHGVRIQNCYFDGCPVIVDDPEYIMVTGSLFLTGRGMSSPGMGGIVLVPHSVGFAVRGLQITGNVLFGHMEGNFPAVYLWEDEAGGRSFASSQYVTDTVVADNAAQQPYPAGGYQLTHSTTRLKIARTFTPKEISAAGNRLELDLTDPTRNSTLLFRGASHAHYALRFENSTDMFIPHALQGISTPAVGTGGTIVTVALQRTPVGSVIADVWVDQGQQANGQQGDIP